MIPEQLESLRESLAAERQPFVTATVVRVQRPTSAAPGNVALVRADGTLEGFVGGVCAQHSVRLYSLQAMASGEPLLLRILPDPEQAADAVQPEPDRPVADGQEVERDDGEVTVRNPCLSGGAIEVFLEPTLPAPRVVVAGDSPIAAALQQLGQAVGLEVVASRGRPDPLLPSAGDLALVVAAHGRDELAALRAGLDAGLPYVGLVASRRRGAAVLEELRRDGVASESLARVDTPAGLAIGARTPAEVALSILARIVEVRHARGEGAAAGVTVDESLAAAESSPLAVIRPGAPRTARDPICGMTVVVDRDTPSATRDGETFYFCCEGCRRAFEQQAA